MVFAQADRQFRKKILVRNRCLSAGVLIGYKAASAQLICARAYFALPQAFCIADVLTFIVSEVNHRVFRWQAMMAMQKGDAEVVMRVMLEVDVAYGVAHALEKRVFQNFALVVDESDVVI